MYYSLEKTESILNEMKYDLTIMQRKLEEQLKIVQSLTIVEKKEELKRIKRLLKDTQEMLDTINSCFIHEL